MDVRRADDEEGFFGANVIVRGLFSIQRRFALALDGGRGVRYGLVCGRSWIEI